MFFLSVSVVGCRCVSTGGFIEEALAARPVILACSTSDMTTLTTASLEKDLLASPAPTGSARKMSPTDAVHAPRANNLDVLREPKDPGCPRLPQTSVAIVYGPSTM